MRSLLLFCLPLVLLASACSYDNGDAQRVLPPSSCPSPSTPAQSKIDVDSKIEVDAGQGAGVFIEYTSGGHWQVRTTCDVLKPRADGQPNQPCAWDVLVTPQDGSSIVNVVGADLESDDSVAPYPNDTVSYQLLATTSSDTDGFSFDSDPGAPILVDAYLDESCALGFFYWVGDGALHSGSPTNPLILVPAAQ